MIDTFLPLTFLDYPDEIAAIVFFGGCNLRCAYCHNYELVLRPKSRYTIDEIIHSLTHREGFVNAVVISGGEPTLSPDEVIELARQCQMYNLKLKLDTNATLPFNLEKILQEVNFNWVAIDLKTTPEKYKTLFQVDFSDILRSISVVKKYRVQLELRTTFVAPYVTLDDISELIQYYELADRVTWQTFTNRFGLLDPNMDMWGIPRHELEKVAQSIKSINIRVV